MWTGRGSPVRTVSRRLFIIALSAVAAALLAPPRMLGAASLKLMHIASVYSGEGGVGLSQPEGIASRGTSGFIVADSGNGRMLRYTYDGEGLGTRVEEIRLPRLLYPTRVKIDSKNEIYVLDGKRRRIVCLNPDGSLKMEIKPVGPGAPASYVARSFGIDAEDRICLIDLLSERVLILGPEGGYQGGIPFPEKHGFLSDLTVTREGGLLAIDSVHAVVYTAPRGAAKFVPLTESLKNTMRFPTGITTDAQGRIFLLDHHGSRVVVLSREGRFIGRVLGYGWKDGMLNLPSQLSINSEGHLFIADSNNNRVQLFKILE